MLEEDLLEPEYSSVQRGAGFAHPGTMARVGIPLLLVQQANWGPIRETLRAYVWCTWLRASTWQPKSLQSGFLSASASTPSEDAPEGTYRNRENQGVREGTEGLRGLSMEGSFHTGLSCPAEWAKCGGIYCSDSRNGTTGYTKDTKDMVTLINKGQQELWLWWLGGF